MRFNIPTPAPTFSQIVSMCSSLLSVSSSVTLKQEIECIRLSLKQGMGNPGIAGNPERIRRGY